MGYGIKVDSILIPDADRSKPIAYLTTLVVMMVDGFVFSVSLVALNFLSLLPCDL